MDNISDFIRPVVFGLVMGLLFWLLRDRYKWSDLKTALVSLVLMLPLSILLTELDRWFGFESSQLVSIGVGIALLLVLLWRLRKNSADS